jgi:hypothetical protein
MSACSVSGVFPPRAELTSLLIALDSPSLAQGSTPRPKLVLDEGIRVDLSADIDLSFPVLISSLPWYGTSITVGLVQPSGCLGKSGTTWLNTSTGGSIHRFVGDRDTSLDGIFAPRRMVPAAAYLLLASSHALAVLLKARGCSADILV